MRNPLYVNLTISQASHFVFSQNTTESYCPTILSNTSGTLHSWSSQRRPRFLGALR